MKRQYASEYNQCVISLVPQGEGEYEIQRVDTHPAHRNRGHARRVMEEVLADADREGVVLLLVSGLGSDVGGEKAKRLSAVELRDWYTRLGFDAISVGSYPGTTLMQRPPGAPRWSP